MKRKDEDQTNLLLAVVLCMAVFAVWQFFYIGPQMEAEKQRRLRETAQQTETLPGQIPGQTPVLVPGTATPDAATKPSLTPTVFPDRATALAASMQDRLPIATPALQGSITLKGGRIDDLTLVKHHEKVDPKSPNVVLFSPEAAPNAYFAEHGWLNATGQTAVLPDASTLWQREGGDKLTPESPVMLVWDNGQGLIFRRKISVDANYMFTLVDSIENKTTAPVTLTPYARIRRIGTPKIEGFIIQHEGLIGVQGGDGGVKEISYAGALEPDAEVFRDKSGGWVGFVDKYWASALVPKQTEPFHATLDGKPATATDKEQFWADVATQPLTVAAGATVTSESRLFAGAKETHVIDRYEDELGIERFAKIIDWGYLYFITKPLFYLIDWLFQHLGNFGLAILAVTVIVKAAFFPLANKSYESMAKMKKLQPEMKKLQERHKDDKPRQQQELMKLYQEHKINPLMGCIPILLQIPVFFALYKVLYISIDMRHAPFYGWIQDLSAPDPTSFFNLFGLLPYDVPQMLLIGAWPVLMAFTMWLQMQLNPPQPDPTQQMIFNWMPALFLFMFAAFPAGLVIYWTWHNVLSIAQQWYILNRQGGEVALLENLQKTAAPLVRLASRYAGRKVPPVTATVTQPALATKTVVEPEAHMEASNPDMHGASEKRAKTLEIDPYPMTREQAFRLLGLRPGANRKQIHAAHKRRIARQRTEANGTGPTETLARIDRARNFLLGQ